MSTALPRPSIARNSQAQHWLQISLLVGAVADAVLGLAFLLVPAWTAELLGVPLPGEGFYLVLLALLLGLLAGFYLLAAYDPRAYVGNVLLAIVGRSAGAITLFALAATTDHLSGLYPAALGEAAFAVVHGTLFALWRR